MQVRMKIERFDPNKHPQPRLVEYVVDVDPTDRVLDALNAVKWLQDGSLTYRRSCAHGMCGSDAVRINGRNRLACKALMKDVGTKVTVQPILGFKVLKDLIVDLDPFFAKYESIRPYLINDEPPPESERLQSPAEQERFEDPSKCILCAACTGSCPTFWANPEWLGPAACVAAHRFLFDSRDRATVERLELLNRREGPWRCRTIFNCTDACPRDIEITHDIQDLKRALLYNRI